MRCPYCRRLAVRPRSADEPPQALHERVEFLRIELRKAILAGKIVHDLFGEGADDRRVGSPGGIGAGARVPAAERRGSR